MRMNKTRVRVSIVIPAYNEERHLTACLEAIEAQTVAPYEVIVVDNNSTDKTAAITREFPFVVVVDESKQGIVHARNAGFNVAKGDIIGRIDADIRLPSNWVEHVQRFYEDPRNEKTAWTGLGRFYNVPLPSLVNWMYELVGFKLNRLLLGHYPLWGSSMAITTGQWQAVRDNVHVMTDIHEDLDLAMHLHEGSFRIFYDKSIKVWAELRRVQADRHKLWGYLEWLPRAYKLHGKRSWPLVWFIGVFMLYQAANLLAVVEYLAKLKR
jgi:glycosyltransferase involved in cell wall biosynthesis